MESVRLIALVISFLGMFTGSFGDESALGGDKLEVRWSVTGLGPQTWLTEELLKGQAGQVDRYRNNISPVDTRMPLDDRFWEFTPLPEHFHANWIKFLEEKGDWKARLRPQVPHSDLAVQREQSPYESELELGRYLGRRQHPNLFVIQGTPEGAQNGIGLMQKSRGNTPHNNGSGGRKRRAKRSCVLRRINRFLRKVERVTGRGVIGDLLRVAGGLRGDLQFYRITPNGAGREGIGVSVGAGTANWGGWRSAETNLPVENSGGSEERRGDRNGGALYPSWNRATSVETSSRAGTFGWRDMTTDGRFDGRLVPGRRTSPSAVTFAGAETSGGERATGSGRNDGALIFGWNTEAGTEARNFNPNDRSRREVSGGGED